MIDGVPAEMSFREECPPEEEDHNEEKGCQLAVARGQYTAPLKWVFLEADKSFYFRIKSLRVVLMSTYKNDLIGEGGCNQFHISLPTTTPYLEINMTAPVQVIESLIQGLGTFERMIMKQANQTQTTRWSLLHNNNNNNTSNNNNNDNSGNNMQLLRGSYFVEGQLNKYFLTRARQRRVSAPLPVPAASNNPHQPAQRQPAPEHADRHWQIGICMVGGWADELWD
ncbi:predicted protein [Histoplasma capsulatum var. duboisii H88]|uniref:Predicted protein n=2 Tax=Ajellomyces capsulatus TaxID=5037 RepID=F0URD5_AJEC8|nr:predicted protein [Histoplasma capsulatum H143]EGC48462.1 predicted protein [Histoplasma capsulatum var. duboisii H88]